jgi:hypothetical protein
MQILSGYDLKKGKKLKYDAYSSSYFQPLQMLPNKEKDILWASQNMNYIEWRGIEQLRHNANWMMKNYKLAIGEIEKSDYIRQDNEYADMVHALEQHSGGVLESMEIKNYPFIITVINILVDEFAKRVSHMSFDDKSVAGVNEMLDAKKEEVNNYLQMQATIKQQNKMLEMGISPDSDEGKQMIAPDTIKSLPEIQRYYSKSYRNIWQEWAEHQMNVDIDRFHMQELEKVNFKNMLITDREFWHFKMMENDYLLETWNPPQVAYRKSPSTRYISDAMWIVNVDYLTVPDVIDREGWKMSEEQLLSLNQIHGARAASYALDGKEPDQYWDGTKSYDWNRTGPGIGMRQAMSVLDNVSGSGGDISRAIVNQGEDVVNTVGEFLLRVSTVYWKTQRKFYHLTKIDDQGNQIQKIVGEDYKVTTKPMYNTVLFKEKCKETLVYGEHLDALWVNETWGGVRIGTNIPSLGWQGSPSNFSPIYLGIKGSIPERLPFQFKGDNNPYGCKLPVEGRVFNDMNTKSRALVDNLKMYQIGVNITGNLIQDIMINDYGVVAQIDPNAIPKHSMGEDWGPDAWTAAATIMKTGNVIPMISNGRNADGQVVGHEPLRAVDLSQTNRLMGLMKIFDWFKMTGLDSVGMNPRRTGTPIGQEATATEIKQDVASSYAHTEYLFSQHSDELMPRVHQMRTDLAQYYCSTNPSLLLQYMTPDDAKVVFQENGTELVGRDFAIIPKTSVNSRAVMQKIEQMLLQDNTSDTDFYDKVRAVQAPTLSNLNSMVTEFQKKKERDQQQQQQNEQQQHQAEQDMQMKLLQEKQQFEAQQNELDRQNDLQIAEIKGAGMSGAVDINQNAQNDYMDNLKMIQNQQQHNDSMNLEQRKLDNSTALQKDNHDIQRQKIQEESKRTAAQLKVAQIDQKSKEKDRNSKK